MQCEIVVYIPQEDIAANALAFNRLLGISVFMRGLLTLADAGYTNFTLIAPNNHKRIVHKALSRRLFKRRPALRIHTIFTQHIRHMDVDAITELAEKKSPKVILLNSNLFFTKKSIKSWIGMNISGSDIWLGAGDIHHPHLLGINGMTFKKAMSDPKNANRSIEAIIRDVVSSAKKQVRLPPEEPIFYLNTFKDIGKSEKYLTERIRLATTGIVAKHINKRISLPISRVLARLRVSPNTITVINMLIGLSAGIGAAGRTYTGLLWGAILFQLASIIDGCDGEVAKLTFKASKFGQYIDTISDNFALVSFFVGLTIHRWRVTDDLYSFIWGIALLSGIAILLAIMMTYLKHNTNSFSLVTYDKEFIEKLPHNYPRILINFIRFGKYLLKKDCFSFMFLISAVFGFLPAWLFITTVGVWVGVFILVYLNIIPALVKNSRDIDEWTNG